jgi:predicted nucleic acid-binding protein
LAAHLAAFADLPILADNYVLAAKFFNLCRSQGIQGSNTGFLICAVAVRHDLAVFTTDGDFPRFAKCIPIVLHKFTKDPEPAPARHRNAAPSGEA